MYVCLCLFVFVCFVLFCVTLFSQKYDFLCLFMSKMLRFRFSSLLAVSGCNLNSYFTWSTEFGAFFSTRKNT